MIAHHLLTQTSMAVRGKVHWTWTDRASAPVKAISLADASPHTGDDDDAQS